MNFLRKNISTAKSRVYLSMTPGVGLELIQLDYDKNEVANYAVRELAYNESSREIVDYDKFKEAVADMYEELSINPKVHVVLNLPIVSFGTIQLGLLLPNDAITGAIQGEVEQTYIFRRAVPIIDWIDVPGASTNSPGKETRQILYSAVQESVIEKISEILAELGSTLVGVENSISSTFRALDYMGLIAKQLEQDTTWNLMIVNSVGYSIVSMSGNKVIEYLEQPLPMKSFEEDELYDQIAQDAQIALSNYPANYLYVVSDTDTVSAEALVSRLNVMGSVDFLENNALKQQSSLIPVSLNVLQKYTQKISLQAIGCALADVSDFPLKFNYLGNSTINAEPTCIIPIGEHQFVVTKSGALKFAAIIAFSVLLLFGLLAYVIIPRMVDSKRNDNEDMKAKLEEINGKVSGINGEGIGEFDLKREVEMGVKGNRSKLMNFVASGDSIPQDVWLTYFMTQGNGLVDIKGSANDVSSVYVFFKNMRDSLIGTKLKLQNLEMDSQSVEAAVAGANGQYRFEITNMTEEELKALNEPKGENNNENGENTDNSDNSGENSASEEVPDSGLLGDQPID